MPGNIIIINGVAEYYIGDSKMDELIKFLDEHGIKEPNLSEEVKKDVPEVK